MPKSQRKLRIGSSKNSRTSNQAANPQAGHDSNQHAPNHQSHRYYPAPDFLQESNPTLAVYSPEGHHINRNEMGQLLREASDTESADQQIKDNTSTESVSTVPLMTNTSQQYQQHSVHVARHPMLNLPLVPDDAGGIGSIQESDDSESEERISSEDAGGVDDSDEEYAEEGDEDECDKEDGGEEDVEYVVESNKNPPEPHLGIASPLVDGTLGKKGPCSSSAYVFLDPTVTPRTVYEPFGQPQPDINANYVPNVVPTSQHVTSYPEQHTGYNPYYNYKMRDASDQIASLRAPYSRQSQEIFQPSSMVHQHGGTSAVTFPGGNTIASRRKRKVKEEVTEQQIRPRLASKRSRVGKAQFRQTETSFGRRSEGIESIMQNRGPGGEENTNIGEGSVGEIDRIRSSPAGRSHRLMEEERKLPIQSPENWPNTSLPIRYDQNDARYITDLEAPPSLQNQFTQSPQYFIQYHDMRSMARDEAGDESSRRLPATGQYEIQHQLYRGQLQNMQSANWPTFYGADDGYYNVQQSELNAIQRPSPRNQNVQRPQRPGYSELSYIPQPSSPPQQHQQPQDGNPLIPSRPRQYSESLPRNVQVTVFQEMHSRDPRFRAHESIDDSRPRIELVGDLMDMVRNWDVQEIKSGRRLVRFIREQDLTLIRLSFHAIRPEEYEEGMCVISCIWRRETHEYCFTSVDCIFLLESVINKTFPVEEKNRVRRNLEVCKPTTISKNKEHLARFFRQIMSYDPPRPRTIEKDVKVFLWKMLDTALRKILSKYDVKETVITESNNLEPGSEHLGTEEEEEEEEEEVEAAEEEEEGQDETIENTQNDRN